MPTDYDKDAWERRLRLMRGLYLASRQAGGRTDWNLLARLAMQILRGMDPPPTMAEFARLRELKVGEIYAIPDGVTRIETQEPDGSTRITFRTGER